MPKVMVSYADWQNLEEALMKANIGYKVSFDNHLGTPEMLITIDNIGVMRCNNYVDIIVDTVNAMTPVSGLPDELNAQSI